MAGVVIGVGGTFAYLAGTKRRAPALIQKFGLEWLWRVALEPARFNRIITATIHFTSAVYAEKVHTLNLR